MNLFAQHTHTERETNQLVAMADLPESIKVQAQIRRNAEEQNDILRDLSRWEARMKQKSAKPKVLEKSAKKDAPTRVPEDEVLPASALSMRQVSPKTCSSLLTKDRKSTSDEKECTPMPRAKRSAEDIEKEERERGEHFLCKMQFPRGYQMLHAMHCK